MERSRVVMEWEEKGARKVLLRQLRTKFGPSLPVDLVEALATLTADERDQWVDAVLTAQTLDAFLVRVGWLEP
jgi:hypothetical protein